MTMAAASATLQPSRRAMRNLLLKHGRAKPVAVLLTLTRFKDNEDAGRKLRCEKNVLAAKDNVRPRRAASFLRRVRPVRASARPLVELLGAEQPVAGIAEAGDDEGALIE